MQIFPGYNQLKQLNDTERMVQFHLGAANWQLQQVRMQTVLGFACIKSFLGLS